jgi:energy-coupling factor transporter transmembrane protein EcfT
MPSILQLNPRSLIVIGLVLAAGHFSLVGFDGRLLYLFLLLLFLFLMSFYLAFIDRSNNLARFLPQTGVICLSLLLLLVTYISWKDHIGQSELAKFITPYPQVKEISFLPKVSEEQIQHWLVKTGDPVDKVTAFYAEKGNHSGWEMVNESPFLILIKDGQKLNISISSVRNETIIYYDLSRRK